MKHLRLITVWLLMLSLPIQALAAFTPYARCLDDHQARHAAMADSHHGHADAATQAHQHDADLQHDEDPSSAQAGGHSCCHHVFTGVPSAAIPGMPAPPHTITPRIALLSTLYIPELPQRPPRA